MGWGGSFGSIVKKATNTVADVGEAVTSVPTEVINTVTEGTSEALQEVGTPNLPNTPEINTPDTSNLTNNLNTGIGKLGGGINAIGQQLADGGSIITRNLHELAKLGKEAISGQGGYSDDAPGEGPGPGPTGFEAANAQTTLLTGQRRKGAGRSAHAGTGSASKVS